MRSRVRSCCLHLLVTSLLLANASLGYGQSDPWEAPASYYSGATGTGATLKNQLSTVMSTGHVQRNYGTFRYSAAYSDQDPGNSNNILLAYNRASVSSSWDSGSTWNREHVWPQSRQPGSASNSTTGALSDPFGLRPSNPGINSSRSNKPFGFDGTTGNYGHQGSYYFPGDPDKGDIARSLFYMDTRWTSSGLSLTDSFPSGHQMGDLSSAVAWHYLDPPDEFERRRNHVIYSSSLNPYYSNNRNAFIDHPEFVWSVYMDQSNDSQITIDGTNPTSDGASVLNLNLGAVLVGAAIPAAPSTALSKSGNDGVYYSVNTTGDASSTLVGRHNAFAVGGGGQQTFGVGLDASTSTAGSITGAVTIDNLDITTQGGPGRGSNDADDVINLSLDVLDHATPSFSSGAQVTSLLYDFGSTPIGSTVGASFDVFNVDATPGFTAGLDLDSFSVSGDSSAFTDDLSPFSALAAGGSSTFSFDLDTSSAGSYSATYTFSFSDEDLPGASALSDLTLTLQGAVASAGILGDINLDGVTDAQDIDLLYSSLGSTDPLYDIAQDGGPADQSDVDALVRDVLATEYGDADLNGDVDHLDFGALSSNFGSGTLWSEGNFNGDSTVDLSDYGFLSLYFGFSSTPSGGLSPAPEPGCFSILALAAILHAARARRSTRS